jgi:hypothetical protein
MAVKILDDSGSSDDVTIHRGLQWLLAPTDLDGQNPDPSQASDRLATLGALWEVAFHTRNQRKSS